jgi:hypothetical protein
LEEGLIGSEMFGIGHRFGQILVGRLGKKEAEESAKNRQRAQDDVGQGLIVVAL